MNKPFLDILGNSPTSKVLDMLINNREFDYAISDITRISKVHRNTVCQILDTLFKQRIVLKTRILAKSQLYKIDIKEVRVIKLLDFYAILSLITTTVKKNE